MKCSGKAASMSRSFCSKFVGDRLLKTKCTLSRMWVSGVGTTFCFAISVSTFVVAAPNALPPASASAFALLH